MKDPAFLFYSNDFLSGTYLMNDEQVGKYIRLLCLQHQKGSLSKKDMLNICKTYDEDIFNKFSIDKEDNYFNTRLKDEFEKRRAYSESRSINRKGKKSKIISKTYDKHMEDENEDIIINRRFKKPTIEEVKEYFDEWSYGNAEKFFNYYEVNEWKDSKGNKIRNWKQKAQGVWFKKENKVKKKSASQGYPKESPEFIKMMGYPEESKQFKEGLK